MSVCVYETCQRPVVWRGHCNPHYQRERKAGRIVKRTAAERFWPKVEKTDTCWVWRATLNNQGYGTFYAEKAKVYAHRWSYTAFVGPIPEGLQIDHLCRNRACVNPAHLEPVTPRENSLRGDSVSAREAAQTHCIHGHEFTDDNTYYRTDRYGRQCRQCGRDRKLAKVRPDPILPGQVIVPTPRGWTHAACVSGGDDE